MMDVLAPEAVVVGRGQIVVLSDTSFECGESRGVFLAVGKAL